MKLRQIFNKITTLITLFAFSLTIHSCSAGYTVSALKSTEISSINFYRFKYDESPSARVVLKDYSIALFKDGFKFRNDSIYGVCEHIAAFDNGTSAVSADFRAPVDSIYSVAYYQTQSPAANAAGNTLLITPYAAVGALFLLLIAAASNGGFKQ